MYKTGTDVRINFSVRPTQEEANSISDAICKYVKERLPHATVACDYAEHLTTILIKGFFKNHPDPKDGRKTIPDTPWTPAEVWTELRRNAETDKNTKFLVEHMLPCYAMPTVSYVGNAGDRKSTRLNSSHSGESRMPSSA